MFRIQTGLLTVSAVGGLLAFSTSAYGQGMNVHVPLRYEELDRWDQYVPLYEDIEEQREEYYRPLTAPYRPYYEGGLSYEWELRSYADRYHRARPGYFGTYLGPERYPAPGYVYPQTAPGPPGYGTGDWSAPSEPYGSGRWY